MEIFWYLSNLVCKGVVGYWHIVVCVAHNVHVLKFFIIMIGKDSNWLSCFWDMVKSPGLWGLRNRGVEIYMTQLFYGASKLVGTWEHIYLSLFGYMKGETVITHVIETYLSYNAFCKFVA